MMRMMIKDRDPMQLLISKQCVIMITLTAFLAVGSVAVPSATAGQYVQSCSDCHGMPPIDSPFRNISSGGFRGNHQQHAAADRSTCTRCHGASSSYSFDHMTSGIRLSDNINDSPATGRYSVNATAVTFINRTTVPNLGTCTNVNCHFESPTPVWGSAVYSSASDCAACHGVPGPSASHARHNQYYTWSDNGCTRCHADYKTDLAFNHATSAATRGIRVVLPEGSYSGDGTNWLPSRSGSRTFGTCTGVYCHSNGAPFDKATVYASPTWGGSALACTSCHSGGGDTTDLSGRHAGHTAASSYAFTCDRCHNGVVTGTDTVSDTSRHVDGSKTVSFKEGGAYTTATTNCSAYCHSDARGGAPLQPVKWSEGATMACFSCHKGRTVDSTLLACTAVQGAWSSSKGTCVPDLTMSSDGHHRLVGPQWVRKYPCYYCHNNTVDAAGAVKDRSRHLNGTKDVVMAPQWNIVGRPASSYNPATKVCNNVYCHSDGTTEPEDIRPFAWTAPKTECNTCHGHPTGSCSDLNCHDGRTDVNGVVWTLPAKFGNVTSYTWPAGEEWMGSMPMFPNQGAGTARANSHPRHLQTDFTCDQCHATTIRAGACTDCHVDGVPSGGMSEVAHIDATFHVNKNKDVAFSDGGTYNPIAKTCSNTRCHTSGVDPVWGGSTGSAVTCLSCHGTAGADVEDFDAFNGVQGKINLTAWVTTGHGRYSTSGRYPVSNNPAANFPGNPCWYCHDNDVLHKDASNPYRLRMHPQYERRFAKECVYCHMEQSDTECMNCHNSAESLAPQLVNLTSASRLDYNHAPYADGATSCIASCHSTGATIHRIDNARFWTPAEKEDVRNQYMMMGVCLQCHDDDSGGQCASCHTAPPENPLKYSLGFDPLMEGTRFIKPKNARASSAHFGYKHYRAYEKDGTWKGGKFCWDCHDPHGDSNIYMVQSKVATRTDGTFGKPLATADVVFIKKVSGKDYANSDSSKPYNGICQVCHSRDVNKHYLSDGGDRHNESRLCTLCHEHRFADSHANKQSCNSCHTNSKPVPKHAAFTLPRDCTKCHAGIIGNRMDVMTQLKSNSHHVQFPNPNDINNRHCYPCHWETTPEGLIDNRYHEGYNYKTYSSVRNAKVDLVVWKPAERPTYYNTTTAVTFLAKNIGTVNERSEAAKVTTHCLSCHSDQNNDITPFDDCKTPRQYAWDFQSIEARYSQAGSATWGKYPATANAAKKNVVKTFSAHGNVAPNQGGWDKTTGVDGTIRDRRKGTKNVECFDCHSSHGSSLVGITSSYLTFNNTRNGGNLKETQAGKGGYSMTYKASSNSAAGSVNPYSAGAGQCFDCHFSKNAGVTPWGFNSTFGVMSSIKGYMDPDRFGDSQSPMTARTPFKTKTIKGGHLKASSLLNYTTSAQNRIFGLCTPCHDPHGVSPILGENQGYGVPLLKGTWTTSPYLEDFPAPDPYGASARPPQAWGQYRAHPSVAPVTKMSLDRTTFGGSNKIAEDDSKFAGLCIGCHVKGKLTDGVNKNTAWKGVDRIHESVKGWGANTEHAFTCSKCHSPHATTLPRLMVTNCLNYTHRGFRTSGGTAWRAALESGSAAAYGEYRGYPSGNILGNGPDPFTSCHGSAVGAPGTWPAKNLWNTKTPW